MPELPEVETTRRGIAPHLIGHKVTAVRVREARLRWPVPRLLAPRLTGRTIIAVRRRAKYLLLDTDPGTVIIHLGMSGSLRIVDCGLPYAKHDHLEIALDSGRCLRLHDPRRFGCALWADDDAAGHALLAGLGPEPLGDAFSGEYLFRKSRKRTVAIRNLLLNGRIVAGIGNIYANEALFLAGIRPGRAAGRLSRAACGELVAAIKAVLQRSITVGGTTLRDFVGADGSPGYFSQTLNVYDRDGAACRVCGKTIKGIRLGQRSGFYCPGCQR